VESVRGLFGNVLNGNYKIEGLDSVEPILLDKIQILQGDGPVSLDASLSKLKIFGMSKAEFVQNQLNFTDYTWLTKLKIPKLRLEADYRMKGQILVIPLNVSVSSITSEFQALLGSVMKL
jgi:Haemolymph juvenile hormone binding protein (JHBP)